MTDIQSTDERVLGQKASLVGIRPARIVEIREDPLTPGYSWYKSWTTGCESMYALLSKFALLNCLPAREIANLFVSSTCGRKSLLVQQLNLDLRAPDAFDLPKIARLCRTAEASVRAGFVRGKYANNLVETCSDLRYCPECLERGFHSALFQLAFIPRCPIHHTALRQQCEHCGGIIPYSLSPSTLCKPFVCPHCDWCFAPALREGPKQDLRMSAEALSTLEHATDIACAKSQLFGSAQQLGKHFSFFGRGRLVLSGPSIQRSKDEYYRFIDAIVHHVDARLGDSPADFSSAAIVVEIVRGRDLPQRRIPRRCFLNPSSRRWLSRSKEQSARTGVRHGAGSRRPPSESKNRPRGKVLSESVPAHSTFAHLRNYGWDGKLLAIYPVYQAIRRYVYRQIVSTHRRCVRAAAMRMWWDVEGDLIARFCPAAEAFLRWRMFWEGFGVPADLFRSPRHPPYGVLAWLCDGAPICAEGWTAAGEQWLTHRVFAMQCVRNFYEWLSHCESKNGDRPSRWLRADIVGSYLTYWAASGNDTPQLPLRIFMDRSFVPKVRMQIQLCSLDHRDWHQRQLLRIVR